MGDVKDGKEKRRKLITVIIALLLGAVYAALLFLPYPRAVEFPRDSYRVVWADGTATEESFASAYSHLDGVGENGEILLRREGLTGRCIDVENVREARDILEGGDLAPMLTMDFSLDRLGSAALYHVYGGTLYFDAGDWFAFTGQRVEVTPIRKAERVFFTGGELLASSLLLTEAKTLIVGDLADFSYKAIYGTAVTVEGRGRYAVRDGAILDTDLGGALKAGQPLATEIVVPDVEASAVGALLPCRGLVSLDLPFVGSGPVAAGEKFRGELGYLFAEGEGYYVPETLKRVKVRGGALIAYAFYACPSLEEIDACGVDPEAIEPQAFAGLENLRILHSPRRNVALTGEFVSHTAPCGCTVYERKEG